MALSERGARPLTAGLRAPAFTRTTWWPHVWPPLVLTLLVILALGQFLQVGLVSTDWWPVLSTNQVNNLSDFVRAFREPIGAGDPHFIQQTARHYRPIAVLSDALDYKLYGLDFPAGWQLTNLLVHLGVTLGVYGLGRTLGLARWAATLAAAVFTLNPAIVGTVPAIARRHDTLSALFFLPSVILLIRGQRVLPAFLFVLSILSKETSLAALPFVPLMLRAAGQPMRRAWVLVPPAIIAVGMRVLALGDLGGYGTATYPSVAAIPIYWDKFAKYFIDLLYPLPIRQGLMAAVAIVLLLGCVAAVATVLPDKERFLVWLGLAWVVFFALFYAGLKVYAGSWYLYFPLIAASIAIAAMVQGGLKRRPDPIAWAPVGLAGVMIAVIVVSSPLITPYPNWSETTVLMDEYLRQVDTCTEDGNPPLAPPDHDARAAFVNPTGLLDYSVTAYIALKYPNGRPCARQ
ncbi:MAG: hypothetical protein JO057_11780 [Chloroflexi bacterium]|nr:hypothetical protein [Chloroflexota bacterium]